MTRGRLPKSDAEKAAKGTLKPCRVRRTVAVGGRLADPPAGLPQAARDAWRLALETAPEGMLTALDVSLLERWARNYVLYRKAARRLEQEDILQSDEAGQPTGRVNPTLTALLRIQATLASCERELGFTPLSRTRVSADGEPPVPENPFEQF